MILVSAFYAVSDTPVNVYYLVMNLNENLSLLGSAYYLTMFITFFYFCANPFIYAVKFDPVKRVLLGLIPCKKASVETAETAETNNFASAHRTAAQ